MRPRPQGADFALSIFVPRRREPAARREMHPTSIQDPQSPFARLAPRVPPELELTLLMPCLDEARTLAACVDAARGFLATHGIAGEVLVADNGSRDGSVEIAERHGARVVHVEERGYGAALAAGIAAARGRYVVMGDSDGSYDWSNLSPFLAALRGGAELVVGNRYRGGIRPGAMPLLHRYLGNPVLTGLGRRLFGSRCGDFYCGQRGFVREAALGLELRSTGMEYALEMLAKAALFGLRVEEVPVVLSPDGRGRRSHLRTWRDGWRSLRLFLLYSPRWLLVPGALLAALGLAALAWALAGGRGARFELHALLYGAAAVGLGAQLAFLSLLAKLLAVASGRHPPSARLERASERLRPEHGILPGGALLLAGVAGSARALQGWAARGTDALETLRTAVPAVLVATLGAQLICWTFCLGLVEVRGRRRPERHERVERWTRDEAA